MGFTCGPIRPDDVSAIVEWHYDGPYSFYDTHADRAFLELELAEVGNGAEP